MPFILFISCVIAAARTLNGDWTEQSLRLQFNHTGSRLTPLAIQQSTDGWLWVATTQGFFRFDGQRFFAVQAPPAIDLSQPHDIAVGPNSLVWLAAESGLFRWEDGKLTLELAKPVEDVMVSHEGNVFAIAKEPNNFSSKPAKLLMLPSGQKRWVELPTLEPISLAQRHIGPVLLIDGARIARIDEQTFTLASRAGRPLNSVISNLPGYGDTRATNAFWRDVAQDAGGAMWARTGNDVFRNFSGTTARFFAESLEQSRYHDTFFEDSRNRLWIMGTRLQLAAPSGLTAPPAWARGFQNVTAMFEDRNGTLWVGQTGQGLTAIVDDRIVQRWSHSSGLDSGVNAIARDSTGSLFAATPLGIRKLDSLSGRWTSWGGLDQRIPSIAISASGSLLAVPKHPEPLGQQSFFEFASARLPGGRKGFTWNDSISYFRPRLAVAGPGGFDWLAAVDATYVRPPGAGWQAVRIPGGTYVSDIQPEPNGAAYLGHENGVSYCLLNECQPLIGLSDQLLNFRIRSITAQKSEIWVAYRVQGGFSLYRKSGNVWRPRHFMASDGYGPPDTHFLRRDVRGWIWRGTPDGLFVCDGVHFEPQDWLQIRLGPDPKDSVANVYGFFEESAQSILVGTASGLVRIFPQKDWFSRVPLQLATVRLDGVPVLSLPDEPIPAKSSLEFELARPGQLPNLNRLISHRFNPADQSWKFSSDGIVRYQGLAPRFRTSGQLELSGLEKPLPISISGVYDLWAVAAAIVLPSLGGLSVWWWRRHVLARRLEAERQEYFTAKQKFLDARRDSGSAIPDWAGTTIAERFDLHTLVARGGFADVYHATDKKTQSPVALKILHPMKHEIQWRQRRFLTEVEALARLDHPGILRILAHGDATPQQPFLVTEWIDGKTLREALAGGPFHAQRARDLILKLAEALANAQSKGILHRDLKPENIMLLIRDGLEVPVLIDFGIATIIGHEETAHSTQLAGSLGYVAPERWFGPASPASDVYSLATIAFELFTGTRYADSAPNLEDLSQAAPAPVANLIRKCLSIDPQDRPATANDFLLLWQKL